MFYLRHIRQVGELRYKMVYENTKYNFIFLILKFVLNYVRYFFLTTFVLFIIAILLFIILTLNPGFSFAFLKYFSFINPIFNNPEFTMSSKELIQIFSIISFIFMIVVSLVKLALKRLFNIHSSLTTKRKWMWFFSVNSIIYLFAIFIVLFNASLENGLVLILVIFYVISSIAMISYFLFDFLLKKLAIVLGDQNK